MKLVREGARWYLETFTGSEDAALERLAGGSVEVLAEGTQERLQTALQIYRAQTGGAIHAEEAARAAAGEKDPKP